MPPTQDQEDLEHEWKVKAVKADVALKAEQTRWEPWTVVVSVAAVVGTFTGALGYYIGLLQHH